MFNVTLSKQLRKLYIQNRRVVMKLKGSPEQRPAYTIDGKQQRMAGGENGQRNTDKPEPKKPYRSAKSRKLFEDLFVIYSENCNTRAGGSGSLLRFKGCVLGGGAS